MVPLSMTFLCAGASQDDTQPPTITFGVPADSQAPKQTSGPSWSAAFSTANFNFGVQHSKVAQAAEIAAKPAFGSLPQEAALEAQGSKRNDDLPFTSGNGRSLFGSLPKPNHSKSAGIFSQGDPEQSTADRLPENDTTSQTSEVPAKKSISLSNPFAAILPASATAFGDGSKKDDVAESNQTPIAKNPDTSATPSLFSTPNLTQSQAPSAPRLIPSSKTTSKVPPSSDLEPSSSSQVLPPIYLPVCVKTLYLVPISASERHACSCTVQ